MYFKLNDNKKMFESPLITAPRGHLVFFDSVVQKLKMSDDEQWIQVLYRSTAGINTFIGWFPTEILTETEMPSRPDFTLWAFLKACVTAELWINRQDDTEPHFVSADYLIALANIESKIENIGEETPGSDAVGPFQISSQKWKTFIDSSGAEIYDEHDRQDPLDQIFGQSLLARNDIKALSTKIGEKLRALPGIDADNEIGPFVPSLVDVFLAHIAGVASAVEFRLLKFAGQGDKPVTEVLSKHHATAELEQLLTHRRNFLRRNPAEPETTDGMFVKIETRLDKELKKAFKLVKEHIPEDLPVVSGNAPWMVPAKEHLEIWRDTSITEGSARGKELILEYFSATDLDTDKVLAWCGAFTAFCMKTAGSPSSETIVKGASWAANWKTWGNTDIPKGTPGTQIPEGAVVVMSKSPGTAGSGHVGLFVRTQTGQTLIEVLGGNQSDRVKLSNYSPSKVAAIRWFSADTQQENNLGNGASIGELASLLNFIGNIESTNNYNAYFSRPKNMDNPVMISKTLNQVLAWQRHFLQTTGKESAAVGKYQIITKTLKGLIAEMRLTGNELFDEEMQDRMAVTLLKRRKLGRYLAGKISKEYWANNLAMEWASLPMVTGPKKGRSYYSGVGSNKSLVSVDAFLEAVTAIA